MSYGEYGGNGSVQSAVWLGEPDLQVTQLNRGPEAWVKLDKTQLSRRAQAFIPKIEGSDLTFYGKDNTPAGLGNFRIRVRFQNEKELTEAATAFRAAIGAKQLEVEFGLQVVKDSPGQVKLAWGAHGNANLGDDQTDGNGTPGPRVNRPRGLMALWQRFLSLFR
jgi:hypothetical protein